MTSAKNVEFSGRKTSLTLIALNGSLSMANLGGFPSLPGAIAFNNSPSTKSALFLSLNTCAPLFKKLRYAVLIAPFIDEPGRYGLLAVLINGDIGNWFSGLSNLSLYISFTASLTSALHSIYLDMSMFSLTNCLN